VTTQTDNLTASSRAATAAGHVIRFSYGQRASDAHPQLHELPWQQFVQWLESGTRSIGEKDGPYVVLADFNGGRRALDSLVASYGVPLDFDAGWITADRIAATLNGYAYAAYTSYSHQPGAERWRVFVPVATPMDAATHRATWATLSGMFGNAADGAAKDATRLSYLPGACVAPEAARIFHADGTLFVPAIPAPPPPVLLQAQAGGPVDGWNGPTDDTALIAHACNMRTRPDERFGGPVHFAMLWNANEEWLARQFPPSANEQGQPYSRTRADMALAGELAYLTGSDRERMGRLMLASGLARDDDDWRERKVWRAVDEAVRTKTQWAFMKVPSVPTATDVTPSDVPVGTAPLVPPPSYVLDGRKLQYPATIENLVYVLSAQRQTTLGFDQFRGRIMIAPAGTRDWRPLSDTDMIQLRETFARDQRFAPISKDLMHDALQLVAERYSFDSAIAWLDGLSWDGVPRVAQFIVTHCGAADDEYARAVSLYIWTGLAARVLDPGCQLDMVVALQSPQGKHKSTGLQAMVPTAEWFTDGLLLHEDDDDFKRLIRGKLVVEVAEMAGLSKADITHLKRSITRRTEEWIEKWKTQPTTYARRCMLFATTNEEQFLPPDETGQRRWLPVEVGGLDRDRIAADRLQLWAEGAALYRQSGVAWADAERLAAGRHHKYEAADVWEADIERWLNTPTPMGVVSGPGFLGGGAPAAPAPPPSTRPLALSEVLQGALRLDPSRQDAKAEKRAGRVMRQLGYEKRDVRSEGKVVKRWVRTS
jgi:hypothetical protein